MKKNGYEETTTMATDQRLKLLARNVNLDDPEEVKDFIAKQSWSPYFKNAVSYAYDKYVKANGLSWNITIYRTHHRLRSSTIFRKDLLKPNPKQLNQSKKQKSSHPQTQSITPIIVSSYDDKRFYVLYQRSLYSLKPSK